MKRHLALLAGFSRQGLRVTTAYTAAFWMELLNVVVKIAAITAVWRALYDHAPGAFPVDRRAMVTYAVVTQLAGTSVTWWSGAHFLVAQRLRLGTITADLLRPVSFPFQLFCWQLGESGAVALTTVAPAAVAAIALLGLGPPVSPTAALAFAASLSVGFVIMFATNFLVGMIVVRTLSLSGVQHAYHGVVTLLSGLWIPFWFYPSWLATLAGWLPFRSVFFTPAAIYVGYLQGEAARWAIAQQLTWMAVLLGAVHLAWGGAKRRLVVQGG
ncbi:MAG: ABC transporter permease [Acidimicrobiia bacterium]